MALVGTPWQVFGTAAAQLVVRKSCEAPSPIRRAFGAAQVRHDLHYLEYASTLKNGECTYDGIGPLPRRNRGIDLDLSLIASRSRQRIPCQPSEPLDDFAPSGSRANDPIHTIEPRDREGGDSPRSRSFRLGRVRTDRRARWEDSTESRAVRKPSPKRSSHEVTASAIR